MGLFGGSGGEVSGYNCEKVNALRNVINKTAQESGKSIVETLRSDIVVPMSSAWYAPEAVTFFEGFAKTVKASGEGITEAFDSFRAAVEKAGANWAESTSGETPSLPAIETVELVLDYSAIQPNNAGNITIDEASASSIASKLGEVEATIKSNLEGLAGSLDAETAFIGHGQADALQKCFVTVSGEIYKIFKYLTEGENSLQSQIKATVTKYQDVSTGISDAFNNGASA